MSIKQPILKPITFAMFLIALIIVLGASSTTSFAQSGKLEHAVRDAVISSYIGLNDEISVSIVKENGNYAFGFVAIHAPNTTGAMPEINLFIGKHDGSNWIIGLENTDLYNQYLLEIPYDIIPEESQGAFLLESSNGNGTAQLSLPWPQDQSWSITGGPHPHMLGQVVRSSLDFNIGGGGNGEVRSARDGTVYYTPQCPNMIRIDHADGWQTKYYHVKNISVTSGQHVDRGQFLGYTSSEAGCGGLAYGNHVHFALLRNNEYQAINGHDIGGWTVSQGTSEYEGCLKRDDTLACASSPAIVLNDGVIGSDNPPSTPIRYVGPFTNPTYGGGSAIIDIVIEESNVSGYINFTNNPGVQPLCGAGAFNGTRSGNAIQFSFVSADADPGCNFDDGLVFNVTGELSGNNIVNGVFSVNNVQGGAFSATRTARYEERFNNPQYGSGTLTIDIGYPENSVAGYMNFTNDPGVTALCGAGSFAGSRTDSNLNFSFISNDPDSGCTFDDGLIFTVNAHIVSNHLNGTYAVSNGQGGTFDATPNGTVDNIMPTGEITSPITDSVYGPGSVLFSANARDNVGGSGVKTVYYWANYALSDENNRVLPEWHLMGSPTEQPYQVIWSIPSNLRSQSIEVGIHVEDNNGNYCINPASDFTCYDLNSKRTFAYIESLNNPNITENWIPNNYRAYLNQLSLEQDGHRKCNGASAAMYLAMRGIISSDQDAMASTANVIFTNLEGNFTADRLAAEINKNPWSVNVDAEGYNSSDGFNRIKQEIDDGYPVILLSTKLTSGHYVVIVGYRIQGSHKDVIVYDPFGRWAGQPGLYDKNADNDVESAKGRWVYYAFEQIWGCDNCWWWNKDTSWLITRNGVGVTDDKPVLSDSLSKPDVVSLEPTNMVTYEGLQIPDFYIFIPLVIK